MSPLPLYRRRPKPTQAQDKLPMGCRDYMPDYDGCVDYQIKDLRLPTAAEFIVGLVLWTVAIIGATAWVFSMVLR
jgi:hypothetical protein